jgi:hypothetical protein
VYCGATSDEGEGHGKRAWDYVEIENPGKLLDILRREHWGWKQL